MTLFGMSSNRLTSLLRTITRHLAAMLLANSRSPLAKFMPEAWRQRATMSEAERLRTLLEELGGSFLKLGQMLAQQPDLIPHEYCDALCKLFDRVPAFTYAEVERVFLQEFGHPPSQLFESFDPEPIASASIGQVHKARKSGQSLAIKVQRPGAEQDFGGDIRLLKLAITWIGYLRLRRFTFLIEPIKELIEWTTEELDFRHEATFMEVLGRGSTRRPHQIVPRVFRPLTSRRILTMEFLDGITLLDYSRAVETEDLETLHRLAEEGFDAEQFCTHVIDNFLHQAFVLGVFHADLHPANLMILPGNVVGYLDLGITGTLSLYTRRQLAQMTLAYTQGDVDAMGSAFRRVSQAEDMAAEAFSEGLLELSEDWYDRAGPNLRLRKSFTRVMLEMLRLSRQTNAWTQRDVIKYIRSSIATDGLIQRCAPGLDLGHQLARSCARHLPASRPGPLGAKGLVTRAAAGVRQTLRAGWQSIALFERLTHRNPLFHAEIVAPARGSSPGSAGRTQLTLSIVVLALWLDHGGVSIAFDDPLPYGIALFLALAITVGLLLTRLLDRAYGST